MPRMLILSFLLLNAAGVSAQGMNFFAYDAMKLDDAKALAKSSLPSPEDLGPDWKQPWNLPISGGKMTKESHFWDQQLKDLGPAGMSEADARTRLGMILKMLPPEMKQDGVGDREMMAAFLYALQAQNQPSAVKLDCLFQMMATLAPPPGSEPPPYSKANEKKILEAMFAPYKDLNADQVRDKLIKEVTLANRRTRMEFVRSNNWEAVAKNLSDAEMMKQKVWVGRVTVNLTIIDSARVNEISDLKPADSAALEARMNANLQKFAASLIGLNVRKQKAAGNDLEEREKSLEKELVGEQDAERRAQMRKSIDDIRKQREEQARKIEASRDALGKLKVSVVNREKFGDNAYVIRIQGAATDTPGLNVGQYYGWIRNGNALVEITFSGNFPEEEMVKEMDRFLTEMSARTASFAN